MKSLFGGSAVIAATLLSSSLILSATPSAAETPLAPSQPQKQEPTKSQVQTGSVVETKTTDKVVASTPSTIGGLTSEKVNPGSGPASPGIGAASMAVPVSAQTNYSATAYSLNGRTASGRRVTKGLIAADPRVLPLGSRVRLEAGSYSGEYTVADTGGAIRGKRIDIWTPSSHEANRFGRRTVKLVVLSYGPKRSAVPRQRKHSARR